VLPSTRRRLAALTGTVALFAAGCGAESPREVAAVAESPPALSPSSATVPTPPPSGTAEPSKPATAPTPTRSTGTKPAGTKSTRTKPPATKSTGNTATSGKLRISNLSLTVPRPEDGFGRPVKAIHQEGCGSPDSANIHYTVTVPGARFRETWYEYEVDAPTPLRGKSDDYEMVVRGDSTAVKSTIGPLARKSANAAGGKLTITVVVVDNTSGDRATARLSASLLPCD
jgi:hypothetical protein